MVSFSHEHNVIRKCVELTGCVSCVFNRLHAQRSKRYLALSRFSILEATESWMGPGNEATSSSKSCTSTGLCCCVQLQQRVLHAVALEHAQPLNSNPTHSHVAVWFALWTPSHKQALSLLPSSHTQQQGQLVLGTRTPHVGHPACSQPVPPKCIK